MAEFKVGDRVRVYGADDSSDVAVGEVVDATPNPRIVVRVSEHSDWHVMPQQCRKLKPKQKLEWEVRVAPGSKLISNFYQDDMSRPALVRLVRWL